jgi:hypothetical protein
VSGGALEDGGGSLNWTSRRGQRMKFVIACPSFSMPSGLGCLACRPRILGQPSTLLPCSSLLECRSHGTCVLGSQGLRLLPLYDDC